jgi:hypothetical protein
VWSAILVGALATPNEPSVFFARALTGVGVAAPSENARLLLQDGYAISRVWVGADAGAFVTPWVGIGAFALFGFGSASPSTGGPNLEERSRFLGVTAPVKLYERRSIAVVATPRVGIAHGTVSFGHDVPNRSAAALGLDLTIVGRRAHVGGTISWLRAAVDPIGVVDRGHDFGGLQILLTGWLDG